MNTSRHIIYVFTLIAAIFLINITSSALAEEICYCEPEINADVGKKKVITAGVMCDDANGCTCEGRDIPTDRICCAEGLQLHSNRTEYTCVKKIKVGDVCNNKLSKDGCLCILETGYDVVKNDETCGTGSGDEPSAPQTIGANETCTAQAGCLCRGETIAKEKICCAAGFMVWKALSGEEKCRKIIKAYSKCTYDAGCLCALEGWEIVYAVKNANCGGS